jgi:hypothetical protein
MIKEIEKAFEAQAKKIEDITESRNEWKRLAADRMKEIMRLEEKIEALETSIMFCSGSCRKIS